MLVEFISSELNIEIEIGLLGTSSVSDEIRTFIGKLVGDLASQLYKLIQEETRRLGIFTHEIAHNSKAFKIFIAKEFTFIKERLMQRELAVFLLNNMPEGGFKKFLSTIPPLNFEQLSTAQYFESMLNIHKDRDALDEMEYIYEEEAVPKSRTEEILAIGEGLSFDDEDGDF